MISKFEGDYAFLSNFYPSPFYVGEFLVPTVEHGYQAGKTDIEAEALAILNAKTPGEAKRLGRKCKLRPTWEREKDQAMIAMLLAKFCQNPDLAQKLLDTGDEELVEGNWWGDTYWGVCNGEGQNKLGRALMALRSTMRSMGLEAWLVWVGLDHGRN